jgi:phage terminase small subunit
MHLSVTEPAMPRRSAADLAIQPVPTELPKRLRPPDGLSEGARTEFLRVVGCEKPTHFTKSDLSLLSQYCEAARLAEKSIAEAMKENPPNQRWLAAWREATRTMKDLALRLRLSPQSRQSHNHTRPGSTPRSLNIYDRMRLAEKDDVEQGRN